MTADYLSQEEHVARAQIRGQLASHAKADQTLDLRRGPFYEHRDGGGAYGSYNGRKSSRSGDSGLCCHARRAQSILRTDRAASATINAHPAMRLVGAIA